MNLRTMCALLLTLGLLSAACDESKIDADSTSQDATESSDTTAGDDATADDAAAGDDATESGDTTEDSEPAACESDAKATSAAVWLCIEGMT